MPAVTDFANEAAALAAGFKKLQIDRGAGATYDRFQTILEKPVTGGGQSGSRMVATGPQPFPRPPLTPQPRLGNGADDRFGAIYAKHGVMHVPKQLLVRPDPRIE